MIYSNSQISLPILRDNANENYLGHVMSVIGTGNYREMMHPNWQYHQCTISYKKYGNYQGEFDAVIYNALKSQTKGWQYDWWTKQFNIDTTKSANYYTVTTPFSSTLVTSHPVDYWTYTQGTDPLSHNVIVKDYQHTSAVATHANSTVPFMIGWRNTYHNAVAACCLHVRVPVDYDFTFNANYGMYVVTPVSYRFNQSTRMDIWKGKGSSTLMGADFHEICGNGDRTQPEQTVYPYSKPFKVIKTLSKDGDYYDYFMITWIQLAARDITDPLAGDNQDSCASICMPELYVPTSVMPAQAVNAHVNVINSYVSIYTNVAI